MRGLAVLAISALMLTAISIPVAAQPVEKFSAAKDTCSVDELAVDLGTGFPAAGAVEILFPIPDTDGRKDRRYLAGQVVCVSFDDLSSYEAISGPHVDLTDYNATYFVTYDPKGTLTKSRSRFAYDIMLCEELPDTPRPPSELRFGTFNWTVMSGIKSLKVMWIPNLRKKIESDCDV